MPIITSIVISAIAISYKFIGIVVHVYLWTCRVSSNKYKYPLPHMKYCQSEPQHYLNSLEHTYHLWMRWSITAIPAPSCRSKTTIFFLPWKPQSARRVMLYTMPFPFVRRQAFSGAVVPLFFISWIDCLNAELFPTSIAYCWMGIIVSTLYYIKV